MSYPLSAAGEERVNVRLKAGRSGESMRGAGTGSNVRRVDSPGHRCARPPSLRLRRKEGSCMIYYVWNAFGAAACAKRITQCNYKEKSL
jgi:hypothetical protein